MKSKGTTKRQIDRLAAAVAPALFPGRVPTAIPDEVRQQWVEAVRSRLAREPGYLERSLQILKAIDDGCTKGLEIYGRFLKDGFEDDVCCIERILDSLLLERYVEAHKSVGETGLCGFANWNFKVTEGGKSLLRHLS